MSRLKTLFFAWTLSLLPLSVLAADLGELRVSLLDGDVQVKTQDTGEWAPAAVNMPLASGDRLWVPAQARAELQLRDGSYVRLNRNSALEILTLERDSYQFYLTSGQAYVNFKGRRDYVFQFDTPIAALRAYDKAVFRVDVADNSDTQVTVIKGAVEAENRRDRKRLTAGKTLLLRDDARPETVATGAVDEWEYWNRNRDKKLSERRESARYLPEELESYASDLDEHGRWARSPDYGDVWIPSVHVSVGWAPYHHGRWVWVGGDYVWISHEPWGWAPYHYGRWAFVGHLGWCWVPPRRGAVHWGPGFVGWVHHQQHVAWVPLAPGEIYYGHGHYGPHSVNLLHIDIHKTVVRHSYKNAHVHNGVTTLHRDSFLTGRTVDVKLKANLFLTETPRLGRPDLKPERATLLPAIKEIPRAHLPPATIRDLPVRELKEARPMVKDRSAPVFRGEARERSAPIVPREAPLVQPREIEQRPGVRPTERAPERAREWQPAETTRPRAGESTPRPFETPAAGGEKPREAKPIQSFPEREQRTAPSERRPEVAREPLRPKETPRAVEPSQAPSSMPVPPRQREAPQGKPPQATPAPERPAERPREIKKPPEAPAGESATRRSAPVQTPKKEGVTREEQERANEGVKLR